MKISLTQWGWRMETLALEKYCDGLTQCQYRPVAKVSGGLDNPQFKRGSRPPHMLFWISGSFPSFCHWTPFLSKHNSRSFVGLCVLFLLKLETYYSQNCIFLMSAFLLLYAPECAYGRFNFKKVKGVISRTPTRERRLPPTEVTPSGTFFCAPPRGCRVILA